MNEKVFVVVVSWMFLIFHLGVNGPTLMQMNTRGSIDDLELSINVKNIYFSIHF